MVCIWLFIGETALCEIAQYSQDYSEVNPNAQINKLNKCLEWHNCEWKTYRKDTKNLRRPVYTQTPGDITEAGVKALWECTAKNTCEFYTNPAVHFSFFYIFVTHLYR